MDDPPKEVIPAIFFILYTSSPNDMNRNKIKLAFAVALFAGEVKFNLHINSSGLFGLVSASSDINHLSVSF